MDRARGLSLVSLTLVLLLAPLTAGIALTDDAVLIYRVIVVPSDLPLLALSLLTGWRLRRHRDRPAVGTGAMLFAALLALLALSFALRLSPIGAQTVFRMLGTLAVAIAVGDLVAHADRRVLWSAIALVAVAESALAVAQVFAGGPVGLPGEAPAPFELKGASLLPRGTFLHPFPLAGSALVSAALLLGRGVVAPRPAAWLVVAAVAVVPVGITYSRAALAGLVAGALALAPRAVSRPVYRAAIVALVLGAGIPALVWSDGWIARAEEATRPDPALGYRALLQDQAFQLIAEHPLLGVGTGRYIAAARERFPDPPRPLQPVHSVPLIVAADAGILAGVTCIVLLAALGLRALRSGPLATCLFVVLLPYVLVDVFPYVGWQGPVILGLWIGTLDASARQGPMSEASS